MPSGNGSKGLAGSVISKMVKSGEAVAVEEKVVEHKEFNVFDYNAFICGNAGNCDLKVTSNGGKVFNFSVAIGKSQDKRVATWFDARCFGALADKANELVDKGTRIAFAGFPITEKYHSKKHDDDRQKTYYFVQCLIDVKSGSVYYHEKK